MSCAPWDPPSAHSAPNPAQATMLPPLAGRGDARYGSIATCALRDASVRSPAPETRRQTPPPDPPQREHNAPPPQPSTAPPPAPHNGSTTRPRPTRRQHHRQAPDHLRRIAKCSVPPPSETERCDAGGPGPEMWHQRRWCGAGDVAPTQVFRGRRRGTNAGGPGPETWH